MSKIRPIFEKLKRFASKLGPGIIAGASDDDPSAVTTYSIAGATYGYAHLWAPLVAFPLLTGTAVMCARLGMVSGRGLARNIRLHFPTPVLWGACIMLFVANTFQLGADLGGMAAVMGLVTGIHPHFWSPVLAGIIVAVLTWSDYEHLARIFKWLALALFSYVLAAVIARPNWVDVLGSTLLPHVELNSGYLSTFVAIMGSAISPYLFFWQAAQMVEHERALGRNTVQERQGATRRELDDARSDVLTGMGFACLISYFIILAAGATLYIHGQRSIESAQEAAQALRPVAGDAAYLLFTFGLVGAGMMGVPALAGSAAYAVSEAMKWRSASLNETPERAPRFYAVFATAVLVGLTLNYTGISAVRMLFIAAVLNGLLAPPLIVLVTLLTSDPSVMGKRANPIGLRTLGWAAVLIMTTAAVGMIVSWFS